MTLSSTARITLLILTCASLSVKAEGTWSGRFSWKVTGREQGLETDLALGLERDFGDATLAISAGADEDGLASLDLSAEVSLGEGIDLEGRLRFDEERARSIDLDARDLPMASLELDLSAAIKEKKGAFVLDEVVMGIDELKIAGHSGSIDFTLRETLFRAEARIDAGDREIEIEATCKKNVFDQGKVVLSLVDGGWSLRETLTFKPALSLAYPTKGTLSASREVCPWLDLRVSCDHAFSPCWSPAVMRISPSLSLDFEGMAIDVEAVFQPGPEGFALSDWSLVLSAPVDGERVALDAELKADREGLDRISLRVSISLSD